jgi:hypothetical protein
VKRKWTAMAALVGLGMILTVAAAQPAPIQLFNGKNLEGWASLLSEPGVTRDEVWSVRDGLLVGRGEPLGYLHTTRTFTSFELRVEWRWEPGSEPGNSGVLMRINGEPHPIPRAIEAQLKSGDAGDLYGFHGMKIDGPPERTSRTEGHEALGDFVAVKKIEGNENAPGEWNVYEIRLAGPNLRVIVNGKLVNEASDCDVIAGPIGLQSEGGRIQFRKVELTPLD